MPYNCGVWLLSSGGFRLFPGSFTVDTYIHTCIHTYIHTYYTALIKIMADAIPYFDHKHMLSCLFSVIFLYSFHLLGWKDGSVLFNNTLNTFSYGYMASDIL